jgi:hypothetical protein
LDDRASHRRGLRVAHGEDRRVGYRLDEAGVPLIRNRSVRFWAGTSNASDALAIAAATKNILDASMDPSLFRLLCRLRTVPRGTQRIAEMRERQSNVRTSGAPD